DTFVSGGVKQNFRSWSDGGARAHDIEIPTSESTFTAVYNGAPTAVATRTPASGASPLPVSFDASGSTDPNGDTLSYDWDFGDGNAHGSGAKPSHTYTASGT